LFVCLFVCEVFNLKPYKQMKKIILSVSLLLAVVFAGNSVPSKKSEIYCCDVIIEREGKPTIYSSACSMTSQADACRKAVEKGLQYAEELEGGGN